MEKLLITLLPWPYPSWTTPIPPMRNITYKQVRFFNLEKKKMLADWIQYEDWSIFDSCSNPSEMVECFSNFNLKKLDEICPLKSVKITKFDLEIT